QQRYQQIRDRVMEEMKQFFRPEFINRLDDIIVFRQLNENEVTQISDLMLAEVAKRLQEREIELVVTDAFKQRVVLEGYDPRYGARPLRRAILRLLEDRLAEAMLAGEVQAGQTATLDLDDDGQVIVHAQQPVPALVGQG
ncbi:MAG: ATP-dependent Clp protease ATP-binding subunit ClpC, partial [Cyanobacteria bacterium P01_H01_bin.121]